MSPEGPAPDRRASPPRLFLVTDPSLPLGLVGAVRAALEGPPTGPRVGIVLRAKTWPARAQIEAGLELRDLCGRNGARLLVSGRADVAAAIGADGVQLPEGGLDPSDVRRLLGPTAVIGRSCHDRRGLFDAAARGADFAMLSPIHEVPGKGSPLGVAAFGRARQGAPLPVIALGGVGPADVVPLLGEGADGIAVIRSVLGAADPSSALRRMLSLLDERK